MDLDLEPGWEKKALIILGVIVVIIAAYVFNPFIHPNVVMDNNTTNVSQAPVSPPAAPTVAPNNTTSNFTTNITNTSGNFKISADQAKKIVTDANPGFTVGQPTQGNIMINNVTTAVWIVPLMSGSTVTKNIYVDASTGIIVGTEEKQ